jgi:hypothetical protein
MQIECGFVEIIFRINQNTHKDSYQYLAMVTPLYITKIEGNINYCRSKPLDMKLISVDSIIAQYLTIKTSTEIKFVSITKFK